MDQVSVRDVPGIVEDFEKRIGDPVFSPSEFKRLTQIAKGASVDDKVSRHMITENLHKLVQKKLQAREAVSMDSSSDLSLRSIGSSTLQDIIASSVPPGASAVASPSPGWAGDDSRYSRMDDSVMGHTNSRRSTSRHPLSPQELYMPQDITPEALEAIALNIAGGIYHGCDMQVETLDDCDDLATLAVSTLFSETWDIAQVLRLAQDMVYLSYKDLRRVSSECFARTGTYLETQLKKMLKANTGGIPLLSGLHDLVVGPLFTDSESLLELALGDNLFNVETFADLIVAGVRPEWNLALQAGAVLISTLQESNQEKKQARRDMFEAHQPQHRKVLSSPFLSPRGFPGRASSPTPSNASSLSNQAPILTEKDLRRELEARCVAHMRVPIATALNARWEEPTNEGMHEDRDGIFVTLRPGAGMGSYNKTPHYHQLARIVFARQPSYIAWLADEFERHAGMSLTQAIKTSISGSSQSTSDFRRLLLAGLTASQGSYPGAIYDAKSLHRKLIKGDLTGIVQFIVRAQWNRDRFAATVRYYNVRYGSLVGFFENLGDTEGVSAFLLPFVTREKSEQVLHSELTKSVNNEVSLQEELVQLRTEFSELLLQHDALAAEGAELMEHTEKVEINLDRAMQRVRDADAENMQLVQDLDEARAALGEARAEIHELDQAPLKANISILQDQLHQQEKQYAALLAQKNLDDENTETRVTEIVDSRLEAAVQERISSQFREKLNTALEEQASQYKEEICRLQREIEDMQHSEQPSMLQDETIPDPPDIEDSPDLWMPVDAPGAYIDTDGVADIDTHRHRRTSSIPESTVNVLRGFAHYDSTPGTSRATSLSIDADAGVDGNAASEATGTSIVEDDKEDFLQKSATLVRMSFQSPARTSFFAVGVHPALEIIRGSSERMSHLVAPMMTPRLIYLYATTLALSVYIVGMQGNDAALGTWADQFLDTVA